MVPGPMPSDPMPGLTHSRTPSDRRAPAGRGDRVHPAFWFAAVGLIVAAVVHVPLGGPAAVAAAAILFIAGGLPHGAYDIALLRRTGVLDPAGLVLAVGAYVAVAAAMALLWALVPLAALVVFLVIAAVHFGEDWSMLDEPLLRVAAGAAVIGAATIGHPAAVSALFVAMSDSRATLVAQLVTAAAPVALLVTAVGIVVAWHSGSRQWAAAMALCLVLLIALPPVAGFALFFVFLHSPRHLVQTRSVLNDLTVTQWIGTGASLSGLAILGWWGLQGVPRAHVAPALVAQAFQLLAAVAVPHLMLSCWLARRLARPARSLALA